MDQVGLLSVSHGGSVTWLLVMLLMMGGGC